ncbi:MAG: hypothetical protein ACREBS_11230 [Nitrososphaerales archaeon]
MSEYSRRIFTFSAVAIVLGISISIGIAYLPFGTTSQSTATQHVSTLTSTTTFVSSRVSTVTMSILPVPQVSSGTTVVNSGTTIGSNNTAVTTVFTTVLSSTSTTVTGAVSSSSSGGANSSVTTNASTSTSCAVTGYPDGIFLQILGDSGKPISGSEVNGQTLYYVNNQPCTNKVAASTNSTGWAYLGSSPGDYYVSFSYSGSGYNLTIPSRPVTETVAAYYVPSGNLTIKYCTYGNMQMCSS